MSQLHHRDEAAGLVALREWLFIAKKVLLCGSDDVSPLGRQSQFLIRPQWLYMDLLDEATVPNVYLIYVNVVEGMVQTHTHKMIRIFVVGFEIVDLLLPLNFSFSEFRPLDGTPVNGKFLKILTTVGNAPAGTHHQTHHSFMSIISLCGLNYLLEETVPDTQVQTSDVSALQTALQVHTKPLDQLLQSELELRIGVGAEVGEVLEEGSAREIIPPVLLTKRVSRGKLLGNPVTSLGNRIVFKEKLKFLNSKWVVLLGLTHQSVFRHLSNICFLHPAVHLLQIVLVYEETHHPQPFLQLNLVHHPSLKGFTLQLFHSNIFENELLHLEQILFKRRICQLWGWRNSFFT